MPEARIKWGILGTSFISEVMADAIKNSAHAELHAIGSRNRNSADNFSHKFGIPSIYTDYQDLLNDKEIDVVYLGLPNHLHKEWIIRSAASGKHVLCEKPFVIDVKEAHEAIDAINKAQVFGMEGLMYRCHPMTKKLLELARSGIIGNIRLIQTAYTAHITDVANPTAGGSIRNLGCYPVSLIRLLTGTEPIEIKGSGRVCTKTGNDAEACLIMKFPDDIMAVVSTADDLKMFWQFDMYGTEGSLKVVSNPWLPEKENNLILIKRHDEAKTREIHVTADKPLFTYQVDTVSNSIQDGRIHDHHGITLKDSLGNITVLEEWRRQVIHQ